MLISAWAELGNIDFKTVRHTQLLRAQMGSILVMSRKTDFTEVSWFLVYRSILPHLLQCSRSLECKGCVTNVPYGGGYSSVTYSLFFDWLRLSVIASRLLMPHLELMTYWQLMVIRGKKVTFLWELAKRLDMFLWKTLHPCTYRQHKFD